MLIIAFLTYYWQNHDDEVKHIPGLQKITPSQGDDSQYRLKDEYAGEYDVEDLWWTPEAVSC